MNESGVGRKCRKGYIVQVIRSCAGYYLGTIDEDGFPNCRCSSGYAKTAKLAEEILSCDRVSEETLYCNGGCGCVRF